MVGAPGTGKSYLARTLSGALGAEIIQTDAVRKELYPEPAYTPAEAAAVYQVCHRRIAEALGRGERVVFDATNLRERRRRALYQLAERMKARVFSRPHGAKVSTMRLGCVPAPRQSRR